MMKISLKTFLALLFLGPFFACNKPQGLQFTGFHNFQIQPVSLASSHISCEVGIHNPNNFSIKVKHVDASIMLSGKHLGDYQLDSSLLLPPASVYYFPVQLEVKNGSLISSTLAVIAGDSLPYTLKGRVTGGRKVATTAMDFDYSGFLTQKDFHF